MGFTGEGYFVVEFHGGFVYISTLSMGDSKGSSCYFGTWKKPNFELA